MKIAALEVEASIQTKNSIQQYIVNDTESGNSSDSEEARHEYKQETSRGVKKVTNLDTNIITQNTISNVKYSATNRPEHKPVGTFLVDNDICGFDKSDRFELIK